PVASAAPTRHGQRARRLHPPLVGLPDVHRVRPAVRLVPVLGHLDDDALAGQCMPDEHHSSLVARDAMATVRHRSDLDLEPPTGPVLVLGHRTGALSRALAPVFPRSGPAGRLRSPPRCAARRRSPPPAACRTGARPTRSPATPARTAGSPC